MLAPGVPAFVAEAFSDRADVRVVSDGPENALVVSGGIDFLDIRDLSIDAAREIANGAGFESKGRPLLAINGILDDQTAAQLEDRGYAYADAAGRAWLPGGRRTGRSRSRRRAHGRQLRPQAVRMAQLLADHPGELWTQRRLASRGESTQVTAQRLLRSLEEADIVERSSGAESGRRVVDSQAMRRWLISHAKPGRETLLRFFTDDPGSIPAEVDEFTVVLTGALAAERMGAPVMTDTPAPVFRVDCDPETLEDMPSLLGGFRTESGANAMLIADPHRLAHHDARRLDGPHLVAPPSRVMLDLFLGPRGETAAKLFAELWKPEM